jgi:hypothetical protein
MSVDGGVSEFGQYQIITINRGARDGVEVGHVLASYRRGATVGGVGRGMDFTAPRWMQGWNVRPNPVVPEPPAPPPPPSQPGKVVGVASTSSEVRLPDERNGLVFIFRVFDKLSYGLVMRSTRPIYIGDVIRTP